MLQLDLKLRNIRISLKRFSHLDPRIPSNWFISNRWGNDSNSIRSNFCRNKICYGWFKL